MATCHTLLAFVIATVIVSYTLAHEGCDINNGWYGSTELGACYNLGSLTNPESRAQRLDWFAADQYCTDLGARLATVRTQAQQDLIRMALGTAVDQWVWLGGNDLGTEGVWEWGYETGDLVVFSSWEPGQPNGGEDWNCIILWKEHNWFWGDYSCDALYYPLCQVAPGSML